MWSSVWLILLIAGLQVRPPIGATNPQRSSIAGAVIRPGTPPPKPAGLSNVLVTLQPGNQTITTNASGTFQFRNLPPGRYTISVSRDGFVIQEDPRNAITISGKALTLIGGENLRDIIIPMIPSPVIPGEVFDIHGERLAATLVQAYMRHYTPYGPQLKIARKWLTDDLGQFRLFGLPNFGEYVVSAAYSDRDRASGLGPIRLSANVPKADEGYGTVFYNSGTVIADAQIVQVAPGAAPARLSINFIDTPQFKVSGRIVPNVPGTRIQFALRGGSLADTNYFINTNSRGEFEIRGVSPGVYVLLAKTSDDYASDVTPVAVTDENVDRLALSMVRTVDITGRISIEGRNREVNLSELRANLTRSGLDVDQKIQSRVASDGSFLFPKVGPGEYDITVDRLPEEMYVRSIRANGRSLLEGQSRLEPEYPIEIAIASAAATVDGSVTKRGDPSPGVQVVLIPDPTLRRRTDRYIVGVTDKDGTFQLNNVPAGRYTAYAFEKIEQGAYYAFAYNPSVGVRFQDRGVTVVVPETPPPFVKTIELRVIPAEETIGGMQ
jgi:carboxypeptidase family protein